MAYRVEQLKVLVKVISWYIRRTTMGRWISEARDKGVRSGGGSVSCNVPVMSVDYMIDQLLE